MKRTLTLILCALLVCGMLCGCEKQGPDVPGTSESAVSAESAAQEGIDFTSEGNEREMKQYETNNPVVAMKIKDYGTVVVELYPDIAPNTVNNFIYLVKNGFYDNNTIHRMMPGFMLQGGDPTGTGSGGPGYRIDLKHTPGVISMARASYSMDSAGSQFFIMLGDASWLDGDYAPFGKVIEGMEVCREIEKIPYYNKSSGKLNDNLTIEKTVVDTKGVEYPDPEKLPGR